MRVFLLQHIDAVITTAFGLWACYFAVRRYAVFRSSPRRLVRAFPVIAPLVVVFGLLQFAMDAIPSYEWHRECTQDKIASAEFPCPTTFQTATDTGQGVSIQRTSVTCNLPHKDINLRLSYNEIPTNAPTLSFDERIAALKQYFAQQGFSLLASSAEKYGNVPGCYLMLDKDNGKSRMVVRVAITRNAIYRVIACSSSGYHDDPAIARFVSSFRMP